MRVRNARADRESSTTSARRAAMRCPLVEMPRGSYRKPPAPAWNWRQTATKSLHVGGGRRGGCGPRRLQLAIELRETPDHVGRRPGLRVRTCLPRELRGALRIVEHIEHC